MPRIDGIRRQDHFDLSELPNFLALPRRVGNVFDVEEEALREIVAQKLAVAVEDVARRETPGQSTRRGAVPEPTGSPGDSFRRRTPH